MKSRGYARVISSKMNTQQGYRGRQCDGCCSSFAKLQQKNLPWEWEGGACWSVCCLERLMIEATASSPLSTLNKRACAKTAKAKYSSSFHWCRDTSAVVHRKGTGQSQGSWAPHSNPSQW